jgi:hypothetical protein
LVTSSPLKRRVPVGSLQGAEDLQQRGLSCAARTYDAHHFALRDKQVNALEHFQRAVLLADACGFDHAAK